jgi:flagellar motor protein MotB
MKAEAEPAAEMKAEAAPAADTEAGAAPAPAAKPTMAAKTEMHAEATTQTRAEPERRPMTVQERYRQLLAQRRPEPRPERAEPQRRTAPPPLPMEESFETVVVSSEGVYKGYVPTALARPGMHGGGAPQSQMGSRAVSRGTARSLDEYNANRFMNSYKVATIQFANGSSRLSSRDRSILRRVAQLHRDRGGVVRVIGHASSRTRDMDMVRHDAVNLQVSVARADSVARELSRLGVAAGDMFVGAVSDDDPIFYEVMPSGEAGNRRTEIFVDY